MPYENGRGCPKCRFAPNGCPSGCCVKPYYVWKGERLTPERKAVLHKEAMKRLKLKSKSTKKSKKKTSNKKLIKQPKTVVSKSNRTLTPGETWDHNGTDIRLVSIKPREDGSHVLSVCVTEGDKKQKFRQLCNSDVNSTRYKGQYGLEGYAQVASCSCLHCYRQHMGRQWSNDLRTKISNAIRHGKHYDKYEPLIGISRDELITRLMEKMRIRYGITYSAVTWDDIVSGRHPFEIDEIIPRQVLYIEENINDVDQWTRIFNHKNIQFLTKDDNVKKGSRIENIADFHIFNSIFPLEGARRVIIDSRLNWIDRRMKRKLPLLPTEKEFFEIHDRTTFF
mgnify:FL=1